jgi:hypothetical protein
MTKASFNPAIFLTNVNKVNLAKPTRFEVHIFFPNSIASVVGIPTSEQNLVSLLCESASLPVQNISVKQQRIYGPNYQRPISVDYGGEGIPMTFLVDGDMNIKSIFDIWISKIVDPIQYFVYHPSTYSAEIKIMQLDEDDNVVYTVVLEDAFPRNVGMLELNHSAQNLTHKLNVTFAYRRWFPVHPLNNAALYPKLDLLAKIKDGRTRTALAARNTMNALEKQLEAKRRNR